jgi:hypothetical protein
MAFKFSDDFMKKLQDAANSQGGLRESLNEANQPGGNPECDPDKGHRIQFGGPDTMQILIGPDGDIAFRFAPGQSVVGNDDPEMPDEWETPDGQVMHKADVHLTTDQMICVLLWTKTFQSCLRPFSELLGNGKITEEEAEKFTHAACDIAQVIDTFMRREAGYQGDPPTQFEGM